MLRHIVGLFDNTSEAQAVARALQDAGFSDDAITSFAASRAGEVVPTLIDVNFPSADAHAYAEGVQRGGALIMVRAETAEETDRAIEIINRYNVIDIHRREQEYGQSGWAPFEEHATPLDQIERRPVAQLGSAVDSTAFQEAIFEVRAQDEEVVVDKQVRVVEEVVINKDVAEHVEMVQDTVRRTDVDIKEMPNSSGSSGLVDRIKQAIGLDTDRGDHVGQRDQHDKS